jgi:hypothetical protein
MKEVEVQFNCFFNFGTRQGWVVTTMPLPLYPWEGDPIPIVQETG